MRRVTAGSWAAGLWAAATLLAAPAFAQTDATEPSADALSRATIGVAERVLPCVVQIYSTGVVPRSGDALLSSFASTGSGAIVDPAGWIVTNAHVVDGSRRVEVLLPARGTDADHASILPPAGPRLGARVVGMDRETDIAVLRVEAESLPFLEFADSDNLRPGELVFAFGAPHGLAGSVSMGVVSATARQPGPDHPMVYIQTDASVNPGNSGGPLTDSAGRIHGINTFILSRSGGSEGLAFAIPANIVRVIYEQIRAQGRVIRGDIGVSAQTVSPRLGQALGLDRTWGVVLGDVRPESPGERAGLRAGDLVLALNGKTMENGRQLDVNIYRQPVGSRVSLDILRDGKPMKVEVEVSRRREPDYSELATNESNRLPEIGVLAVPLGDGVRELLPRLRRRTGLLIVAQSGSPGLDDELQPGDVVHRIGSREVTTLEEARNALKSVPAGSLVALHVERDQTLRYLAVERR